MKAPVYVVDILKDVTDAVKVSLGIPNLNYVYGTRVDILENLKSKDESQTELDAKYPLFALYMPFVEDRGKGVYCTAMIKNFVIATLTTSTDIMPDRYENVFKPMLYPLYYSFLEELCKHKNVSVRAPDAVIHRKVDFPGRGAIAAGVNDFVDLIQLENLEIPIIQTKTC